MGKTALVVSGGGAKGAFAVGAVDYIVNQLGVSFDLFSGTSTGALVVSCLAAGKLNDLVTYYSTASTDTMLTQHAAGEILGAPSVLGSEPLRETIEGFMDGPAAAAVLAGTHPIFLTAVSLQTAELWYLHTMDGATIERPARGYRLKTRDELIGAMLASAAVPVMLPPVAIAGQPLDPLFPPLPAGAPAAPLVPDQFVDGGVREYTPFKTVIDHGATDIYAVILSPLTRSRRNQSFTNVLGVLPRTIDILTEDVADNDIDMAQRTNLLLAKVLKVRSDLISAGVEPALVENIFSAAGAPFSGKTLINLRLIVPEAPLLKGDSLEFDQFDMGRMMVAGRRRAAAVLNPAQPAPPAPDE